MHDLAFQWGVAEALGLKVRSAAVVHLRREAVRGEEPLAAEELLLVEDVTSAVCDALPGTRADASRLLKVLASEQPPRGASWPPL